MLFDLRGRGRRRMIQVIYASLALLMGGGLVFFGVGGTGVGLFNQNQNGGGGGGGNPVAGQLKAAEKAVKANPQDAAAWAALARRRYQSAGFDQNTQSFTPDGRKQLAAAARAWTRYLALNPKSPDAGLARLMTNAFETLNRPSDAVHSWEIIVDQEPSRTSYANLAVSAYAAQQTHKGDLAAAEAIRRAPKAEQAQLRTQLKAAKTQVAQGQSGAATPTTPGN